MENLVVLSLKLFFLIMAALKKVRERVCSSICLALTIIDSKVVTRKFLSQADLSGDQTLCVHEWTEIVMVDKYEDFMLKASTMAKSSSLYILYLVSVEIIF